MVYLAWRLGLWYFGHTSMKVNYKQDLFSFSSNLLSISNLFSRSSLRVFSRVFSFSFSSDKDFSRTPSLTFSCSNSLSSWTLRSLSLFRSSSSFSFCWNKIWILLFKWVKGFKRVKRLETKCAQEAGNYLRNDHHCTNYKDSTCPGMQ